MFGHRQCFTWVRFSFYTPIDEKHENSWDCKRKLTSGGILVQKIICLESCSCRFLGKQIKPVTHSSSTSNHIRRSSWRALSPVKTWQRIYYSTCDTWNYVLKNENCQLFRQHRRNETSTLTISQTDDRWSLIISYDLSQLLNQLKISLLKLTPEIKDL